MRERKAKGRIVDTEAGAKGRITGAEVGHRSERAADFDTDFVRSFKDLKNRTFTTSSITHTKFPYACCKKVKNTVMANLPASPFFPHWAERVAEVNHAFGFKLLTVKKLDASDISAQHNGFLLPRDVVEKKLVPFLTYEEREKASLLANHEKRRRDREPSSSNARRNYDGLNVSVFIEGGWRFELLLTHNDESGYTFIWGNELELLRRLGNFKEGDNVAIWMLIHRDHSNNKSKVSFCFVKIDSSLMIAETSEYDLRLAVL
ncbi:hypothetical protein IEQ34_020748 [Dendrobium chrysotoxum]|uniref:TF-B3 domain-containing protein n=1 Tax=Dendrobium chrysotoxum TaxID=161865 RepID=A0AAV7G1A1_DENCH|nr:hypothetical protein IEQ34_020748 [Dendrobium chrysotoxum]